jgi:hypothetical protein
MDGMGWDTIPPQAVFVGLVYRGKDLVFRFILEYSSVRDFL